MCGGGQGGLNLPLPVPFNPGSRPVFFGSRPFAFFRLRNIAQRCVIFSFFSRFPPPWESRFPPPLLPPPVHLPPPFLPVSRPPVPPTFVALKECPNGKAQGITEAITLAMDEKDQNWKNKTACLGTDGASVMVGQHGGVFGILKRDIPSLISVHCIAHNLELGLQDTLKAIPLFREVKEMLQGMWKYYKYSCKALKELKDLAESMDEKAYKCTKADGSRWVPTCIEL